MTSTELEELLRSSSSEKIKQNKQNSAEELNMDLKVWFSRSLFQMIFSKPILFSYKEALRSGRFMWSAVFIG